MSTHKVILDLVEKKNMKSKPSSSKVKTIPEIQKPEETYVHPVIDHGFHFFVF